MKPLLPTIRTIGDWIYVRRREKNLTVAHVATKMGLATALIQSWEDGAGKPNDQQLEVLAKFLGAPPNSLLPTDTGK